MSATALENFAINATIDRPDLTLREVAVLAILRLNEYEPNQRRVGYIADALHTNRAALTRIGQRFRDAGWITQSMLDSDARACVLTLTKKGRRTLDCINQGWPLSA